MLPTTPFHFLAPRSSRYLFLSTESLETRCLCRGTPFIICLSYEFVIIAICVLHALQNTLVEAEDIPFRICVMISDGSLSWPAMAGDRAVVTIFVVFVCSEWYSMHCALDITTFMFSRLFPEQEVVHSRRPLWSLLGAAKVEGMTLVHQFWEGFVGKDLILSCLLSDPSLFLILTSMLKLLRRAMSLSWESSPGFDMRLGDEGHFLLSSLPSADS